MTRTTATGWIRRGLTFLAPLLALWACEPGPDGPLVARAAGHHLTVNETVSLLAGVQQVPNEPDVVELLADLWVDYTLLAEALQRDPTLATLDVSPLVQQQIDLTAILTMGDSLVHPDTAVTEDELRELYETEGPDLEVRARHILVAFPPRPTPEQRDSVLREASEIRERVVAGEDFAALAAELSDDPGTASRGGDLGWTTPGELISPLDQTAFSLAPGEVSEPVETDYGIHVVKVDDRRVPEFEEVREAFRLGIQQRRARVADSTFITGLVDPVGFEPTDDAADLTRRMAEDPRTTLSKRAADRTVVAYEGGEITLGEVRDALATRPPPYLQEVQAADDQLIYDAFLRELVQREVLLKEANARGFQAPESNVDSLNEVARQRFVETARNLGLASIEPRPSETPDMALGRTVEELLGDMLRGDREAARLDAISFVLRKQFPSEVYESGIPQVIERVARARGPGPAADGPSSPGG